MPAESDVALLYHEPSILTILILGGFLLTSNVVNHIFDKIVSCGLVGQIFLGIAWGTPGVKWLTHEAESTIVDLGYLGLLLLVYEGGLSTSWRELKANLVLSSAVALTGICLPIALSFVLISLTKATSLQAFAAGAALCSTSLGTTFTVLSSSGLNHTRLGVILTSAAMMDDVVGLVMVQVISNLGAANSTFNYTTVVRTVFVSLAFLFVIPVACRWIIKPLQRDILDWKPEHASKWSGRRLSIHDTAFLVHTSILVAVITAASYAGTSNLFAAYLAGAAISWWDSELRHGARAESQRPVEAVSDQGNQGTEIQAMGPSTPPQSLPALSLGDTQQQSREHAAAKRSFRLRKALGSYVFELYYAQPLQRILKPFFFASIGFSVPIKQMFSGAVLWRGLVYSLLMFCGKLACGLWLVRIPGLKNVPGRSPAGKKTIKDAFGSNKPEVTAPPSKSDGKEDKIENHPPAGDDVASASMQAHRPNEGKKVHKSIPSDVSRPISLYPACILGSAMTARGEIGFLISSLAESNGIFAQNDNECSQTFLAVTWAILLCTIVGPLCVGLLVRRVRRLENVTEDRAAVQRAGAPRWDALGVWGVS